MAGNRWEFWDGFTTYVFEINPNDGGSPQYEKQITYKSTAAPNGKTIIFEGRDQPRAFSVSGKFLSQDQYDAFVEWYGKRRQVRVTDDLGRTYWIYITKFSPKRERAIHYAWKHSYTIEGIELDWG